MSLNRLKYYCHYKRWQFWLVALFVIYNIISFLIVPWAIKTNFTNTVEQRLNAQGQIEKVFFNPYALSLTIEGLKVSETDGQDIAGFARFYVNFQTSSLFRWAWTFRDLELLGVHGRFERFDEQNSNLTKLADSWQKTAPPNTTDEPEKLEPTENAKPTRLLIENILLGIETWEIVDRVPETPFETIIGPVEFDLTGVSTLPDRVGNKELTIHFEDDATLTWSGQLTLTPLSSEGSFQIKGPYLTFVADYLQDYLNFSVNKNQLDIGLQYRMWMDNEKGLSARVQNLEFELSDIELQSESEAQPFLSLNSLALTDIDITWPEQQVNIGDISLDQVVFNVEQEEDGNLNLVNLVNLPPEQETSVQEQPSQNDASIKDQKQWIVKNGRFTIKDWQTTFTDNALNTPASLAIRIDQFIAENASNVPEEAISLNGEFSHNTGKIKLSGEANVLPTVSADIKYSLSGVSLTDFQPYIEQFAKVDLKSGQIDLNGQVALLSPEDINITSTFELSNLHFEEQATGSELLGWNALSIDQINYSHADASVTIGKVLLDQLYADFDIEKDQSTTLDRILIQNEQTDAVAEQTTAESKNNTSTNDRSDSRSDDKLAEKEQSQSPSEAGDDAISVSIASVTIKDASGEFSDASLPLPFDTKISEMNGTVSTLSTTSTNPAEIDLEGKVGQYGLALIKGTLVPHAPQLNSNINVNFKNVNIPNFSPYSVKFAGRKIDKGRMDLNLKYQVKESQLSAENEVILRDLHLGEKIEQPGAMNLPLDLALALLKDGNGEIDINLPVSGDLNSPDFSYGSVVGQAFSKVIKGIVTSPFKLLGKLAGSEESDLGHIQFAAGESLITPPEQEKLHQLTKALEQRPNLIVQVPFGMVDKLDRPALQQQLFERKLAEQFGEDYKSIAKDSKKYSKSLEALFVAQENKDALEQLREQAYITDSDSGKSKFDQLTYAKLLEEKITANQNVSKPQLQNLANARQQAIIDELNQFAPKISPQVSPSSSEKVKTRDDWVEIELSLNSVN